MPVETYCPFENKRQPKRRRGIAQLSLSSLQGNPTFHVNRNHEKKPCHHSDLEDDAKTETKAFPYNFDEAGFSAASFCDSTNDLNGANKEPAVSPFSFATPSTTPTPQSTQIRSSSLRKRRRRKKSTNEKQADLFKDFKGDNREETRANNLDCLENNSSIHKTTLSVCPPPPDPIAMDTPCSEKPSNTTMDTADFATSRVVDSSGPTDQGVVERLNEAFSIAFFRATPLDEFRRKCKQSLKHNVVLISARPFNMSVLK